MEITEKDVEKQCPIALQSPSNPTPIEIVYLSNIDQTVAFPVETIFFYESKGNNNNTNSSSTSTDHDIIDRVKRAVSEVLLIPYYFMAGRLRFNTETHRLEVVCNNAGVVFAGAESRFRLDDLGDVSLPNPSFRHLIIRTEGFSSLEETPIFTIQVTRFKCGGFSIGLVTNHSILDGRSAADMLQNLASICRGEGMKSSTTLNINRSCIKARNPPQIKFHHNEYTKLTEAFSSTSSNLINSSFTSPEQPSLPPSLLSLSEKHSYKIFPFTPATISLLKQRSAMSNCSTFEAIVAHVWRARTKAVFHNDPKGISSVLFAVDIRSKMLPPLPEGFVGNAVITACASANVEELTQNSFSFCVEKIREGIERVCNDEYVRSVIDWLEVNRGVPSTMEGKNFYVSAWWKLPFHELDFGHGKPLFGGPVVSGMDEFVLLLSDAKSNNVGGINVWIVLDKENMDRFINHVFDL